MSTIDIEIHIHYKGNMDTKEPEEKKVLHIMLPIEVFHGVREMAKTKAVQPGTYARMVLAQHVADHKREENVGKALEAMRRKEARG